MNHPKFAHFETAQTSEVDFATQVFHTKGWFALWVDGVEMGRWKESDDHHYRINIFRPGAKK
jgi:hypothetical protein